MSEDKQRTDSGWTNFETWCVSEWLPTDGAVWNGFREQLRRMAALRAASGNDAGQSAAANRRRQKFQLGRQLRDNVSGLGYMELPLIYCDLLQSALGRVNWLEIVEHFLGHPFPKQLRPTAASDDSLMPILETGRVLTGPVAQFVLTADEIKIALGRHVQGDWGNLEAEDRRQNMRALAAGCPLQSVYQSTRGVRFWVVTEADRSLTSVLLDEDY
jgi:hypothetical protein